MSQFRRMYWLLWLYLALIVVFIVAKIFAQRFSLCSKDCPCEMGSYTSQCLHGPIFPLFKGPCFEQCGETVSNFFVRNALRQFCIEMCADWNYCGCPGNGSSQFSRPASANFYFQLAGLSGSLYRSLLWNSWTVWCSFAEAVICQNAMSATPSSHACRETMQLKMSCRGCQYFSTGMLRRSGLRCVFCTFNS
jgi:hypothetical protein